MPYEFVRTRIENGVGWVEYNRPPLNAFHRQMVVETRHALGAMIEDSATRVIVVASALERYFSSGADLGVFATIDGPAMAEWATMCHDIVRLLRASPKPLLGAINGTAVGGGLEITYHCDLRFAAEDARLGQPEININLIPPIGTTQALVRLIGRPQAIRFLYEGTLLSAAESLAIGLVDRLVAPEQLHAEVQAYGEELAGKPAEALTAIRRTITEGMELPFEEGLRLEYEAFLRLTESGNFREGVRAFLDKRKPEWR